MKPKIVEISLPEYDVKSKPDYEIIGKKVDRVIEENFPDGDYLLRSIGIEDHPDLELDELVDIIVKTGTDKYDPNRPEVAHEDFIDYDHDLQAGEFQIKNSKIVIDRDQKVESLFGDVVYHFYEHTPYDRGYAVRIDLIIIYDRSKFERAKKVSDKAKELDPIFRKNLFKFKNPDNKKDVLAGLVKVLRD